MNQIKWVFENMKGSRWKFFCGLVLHNLVVIPLVLAGPWLTSELIRQVYELNDTSNLMLLLGLIAGVGLLYAIVSYAWPIFMERAASEVVRNLRVKLYAKLQKLSPSYYGQTRTGDIMMRLTGDLDAMRHFVAWVMTTAVYAVLLFIAGLVVFFSVNWLLASIIFAASPLMVWLVISLRKEVGPAYAHHRETNSQLNAVVQENISGNRVVKAFVREEYEQYKFEVCNQAYRDASVNASNIWAKKGPYFGVLFKVGMVATLVVGGIMVINNQLSLADFMLFFSLNWIINESMRLVGIVINDAQRFFSSTQKVQQLYYARTDIRNKENPISDSASGEANAPMVEFSDVAFKYDNVPVLSDISLIAKAGETIGIMGPTGSGKTTLTMMMSRFMDATAGSVKVNGIDVRDYDLHTLRSMVGMSMQDVFLFSNTIDSNIAYGRIEIEEEEAISYAKMADAHGFIKRMPDGYDTIIGERGVGLSGGQKQRVALARALAYETPILVLDDTTSAVDMETEKYIQEQLAARSGVHTTFIVAQRISSVKNADKIYIIEEGKVTECGTHRELLANKGYYYDIYCLQQGIPGQARGDENIGRV